MLAIMYTGDVRMFVDHRGNDAGEVAILYLQTAALPDDSQRPVTRVELVPNQMSFSTSSVASINDNYIPAHRRHGLAQLLLPRSVGVQPVRGRWIVMVFMVMVGWR